MLFCVLSLASSHVWLQRQEFRNSLFNGGKEFKKTNRVPFRGRLKAREISIPRLDSMSLQHAGQFLCCRHAPVIALLGRQGNDEEHRRATLQTWTFKILDFNS